MDGARLECTCSASAERGIPAAHRCGLILCGERAILSSGNWTADPGRPKVKTSMASKVAVWLTCVLLTSWAAAQRPVVLLWPQGAPGSEGQSGPEAVRIAPGGDHVISHVIQPSITVYLPAPDQATGASVVVIPGGGHSELWMDHEGYNVAAWMSDHGIAAFILKYRLAREKNSTYTIEGTELKDLQRAIRTVRSRAAEWCTDPKRIGVIGFSAGGELALLASVRYDEGDPAAPDPVDRQSSRPDFQGLFYPGIPGDMTFSFSKDTPPAFMACGANDRPDISERLPELYLALKRAGVPVEVHIFAGIGHGFGIRITNTGNAALWPDLFYGWLNTNNFLRHE
jgi:acetyl esterase/lipase